MHNLIEFLEKTVAAHGSKTAVEATDGSFTYAQLRGQALRIASALSERPGDACAKKRIAVYLPKGARCLCAMLGVLYSGNVYVPLDCRAPANRTKRILEAVDPLWVITDEAGERFLTDNGVPANLLAGFGALAARNAPTPEGYAEKTIARTLDVDPAYILFTSGSTGVPKGVVIPHRRVINYIDWARGFFSISGEEVIGNQAPFYFTVSAMDIYLSLATGATLHLIPEDRFSRPDRLLQYLNEHEISLIFWVSSVYHHVAKADALANDCPRFLRHAWFVGEPMPEASIAYWIQKLPDVEFTNLYGSTETDMTICYRIPKGRPVENLPLGSACANTDILLLKEDGSAAKPGEIADIYVRGSCLASGYFQDVEKTRASFIQNPLHNEYTDILYKTGDLGEMKDGLLYFHGRKDHQFKHLGYRIEAGDIESAASAYDGIVNACALYDGEKRQIVLLYEADKPIDELGYRRALMAELPVYMVPTRFVRLDAMPFNANRKKDRMLLKARYIEHEGEDTNK